MRLTHLVAFIGFIFASAAFAGVETSPFMAAKYDPFVGDWLPKNPGDYVAQVIATGSNAYIVNVLNAFDDDAGSKPVAILRGSRSSETAPVVLSSADARDDSIVGWTGSMTPDCCGSPHLEITNTQTHETVHLGQFMRPNPRLRVKPAEGAVVLFAERMRDGVFEMTPGGDDMVSRETFADCRVHVEFRMMGFPSLSGVALWKGSPLLLASSFGHYETKAESLGLCGEIQTTPPTMPQARAERAALEWQALDLEISGERMQVYLNGVKIHDGVKLERAQAERAPLRLIDRGAPVQFRNIWVQVSLPRS